MRTDATIMGGDEQWDLEYKIVYDCCGLDFEEYLKDHKILTRENFQVNFSRIQDLIEEYASYKFSVAYQVLGRVILLIGVEITERVKNLLIKATDWEYEEGFWEGSFEEERKFRLKDMRKKIKFFTGKSNPIEEDLVFRPDLVRFYRT